MKVANINIIYTIIILIKGLVNTPFNNLNWNYNKLINLNDNNLYLFTNNTVESSNRTINMHFTINIKSILSFKNSINKFIDLLKKCLSG